MGDVYWCGKCDRCDYSSDFSPRMGSWDCALRDMPMFAVKYCNGPYEAKHKIKIRYGDLRLHDIQTSKKSTTIEPISFDY